jgi:hypothetical protein
MPAVPPGSLIRARRSRRPAAAGIAQVHDLSRLFVTLRAPTAAARAGGQSRLRTLSTMMRGTLGRHVLGGNAAFWR